MYFNNLKQLIDSDKISFDNYMVFNKEDSDYLIKNGFSFISIENKNYYYTKTRELIDFVINWKGESKKIE